MFSKSDSTHFDFSFVFLPSLVSHIQVGLFLFFSFSIPSLSPCFVIKKVYEQNLMWLHTFNFVEQDGGGREEEVFSLQVFIWFVKTGKHGLAESDLFFIEIITLHGEKKKQKKHFIIKS